MKVYSDSKGSYILLRNLAIKSVGFTEGIEFSCKLMDKKIILEVV